MQLTPRPLQLLQLLQDTEVVRWRTDSGRTEVLIPHLAYLLSTASRISARCVLAESAGQIITDTSLLHEHTNPSKAAHHSAADFFAKQSGTSLIEFFLLCD